MDALARESQDLLAVATGAARAVERQLLAAFRSTVGYSYKRDLHDIVTEHDRASEETIRSVILAGAPDSAILGEEGGLVGAGRVRWYVDPIDGTTNFARGIAGWCVSIAAAIDGRLVAGVVFDPVAGNLFAADLSGAFLNGRRLGADAAAEEARAVLVTGFPNARHLRHAGRQALDLYAELQEGFLAVRNLGSGAIQLAHVAAGWADATMGYETNSWDVAAGALLVEQAGGRYVGYRDGRPAEPGFLAPHYLAVGRNARYPLLEKCLVTLSRTAAPASA